MPAALLPASGVAWNVWIVTAIDYTLIVTTSLTGLFALANTFLAFVLVRHVKPKSGGKLADYVEDTAQTSRANNLYLRRMNGHGLHSASEPEDEPDATAGHGLG